MLPREQALTKYCPHKFPVTAVAGIIAGLVPDSEELIAAINCNCTANDCPKWIDATDSRDRPCDKIIAVTEQCQCEKYDQQHGCNDCPHRYGRCGG